MKFIENLLMTEKCIVLDSCIYFRIGILFDEIFKIKVRIENTEYAIRVHENVIYEYNQQPKLKLKYPTILPIPTPTKNYIIKVKKNEVEQFQKYINEDIFFAEQYLKSIGRLKKTPSYIDKSCLALQMLRPDSILVCSDDSDIDIIASELGIKTLKGSELIELLIINKYVNKAQIKKWFLDLKSINDFQSSYKKLEERL